MSTVERFAGKVAVITGGAAGIGLATVRRLVGEGARVIIGDIDADRLKAAESDLGDAVAGFRCDVRAEDDVRSLMTMAESQFGGLHVAFANAGAGLVAFLASDEASSITGTLQLIDGGAHTRRYPDILARFAEASSVSQKL